MSDGETEERVDDTRSPEQRKKAIDNITRWLRILVVGAGLSLAASLIIGLTVFTLVSDKQDRSDRDRIARAVESCKQYNKDQTRNRVFAHEQIIEVTSLFGSPDKVEQLRHDPRLEAYDAFTAEQFPYRQCTPDSCALSYTDSKIPDCPFPQIEGD